MGIQKDAGEILLFAYKRYVESEKRYTESEMGEISGRELVAITGWEYRRLEIAMEYLKDNGLIQAIWSYNPIFIFRSFFPKALILSRIKINSKQLLVLV